MPSKVPSEVQVSQTEVFKVVEEPIEQLGYVNFKKEKIGLRDSQHEVGKHMILFHELVHIAYEHLVDQKIISRQPKEIIVESLTGALFPILALSGLWTGVTREEMQEFMTHWAEQEDADQEV